MRVFHGAGQGARASPFPADDKVAVRTGLTTLNRLHCFEIVVEEAGFKRATARLHITQPALSYQIKQLEEELGAQLFYRRPGGVCPTEAGRLLFQHAQRVSAAVRHARRAIQELSEGTAGEVRIGTVNSVGIYFLPQLLWTVRERYASTRPTVLYRESDEIIDALLNNHIDLAILADPRIDRRLRYETLFEERVSLVSGRTNALFGTQTIRPKQLKNAQFVALSPQTPTGTLIRRYLERLGIGVEPAVSTENVETVKRMVEIGMGVAFLPDMVTERDIVSQSNPSGRLGRSLVEPPLTRRIVLVTWNEIPSSRAVAAFADEVRRQSSTWPGSSIKA
jgi:LysR family transcriptional regulator, low CO2-responsive transcriptional regulator